MKIGNKYSNINKAEQKHLRPNPNTTIDKLNIDLNIDNYTINDMKLFIRLPDNEEYDNYQLNQKINEKIDLISKLNIALEEKSKIIDFIKRIKFALKDKLNIKGDNNLAGINDESYSITDLQQDMKKLASVVQDRKDKELESIFISPVNPGVVNDLKRNIVTSQLSIDTKFRKNYFTTKSTNFTINLATPLKNVISMNCLLYTSPSPRD